MSDDQKAYYALQSLAHLSLQAAQQLPAQMDARPQWSGIGFSLLGMNFVVSMGELNEMLEVPSYTKLPGVQSWVRGVANVRGRLLPVFDLAAYFGSSLTGAKKQQRLLVIDRDKVYAGLWVDQVFGMKYFPVDTRTEHLPKALPESLIGFVEGCFEMESSSWAVFHPLRLMEQANFLDVAEA
ncbi:MAG: twitching motility protein PilI [Cellvibrionaceae bacterium]|jgi:twitching motility protein PilI